MEENHSGPFGGHFATRGLLKTLTQRWWWDGMAGDIYRFCQSCLTCAAYQGCGRRSKALMQPFPVGAPFERVAVDIMEMLMTLRGNQYVVAFIEYVTKWVEAYPVEDQTSETIARLLIDNVVCRHGVPNQLLSDRGPNLLSELILDVCEILGITKKNQHNRLPSPDGWVGREDE